jgi:hypothetical protein
MAAVGVPRFKVADVAVLDSLLSQWTYSSLKTALDAVGIPVSRYPAVAVLVEAAIPALLQGGALFLASATPGQQVLQLTYSQTAWSKSVLGSVSWRTAFIVCTLAKEMLDVAAERDLPHLLGTGRQLRAITVLALAVKFAHLINWLLLLRGSGFSRLVDRLLGLRQVYAPSAGTEGATASADLDAPRYAVFQLLAVQYFLREIGGLVTAAASAVDWGASIRAIWKAVKGVYSTALHWLRVAVIELMLALPLPSVLDPYRRLVVAMARGRHIFHGSAAVSAAVSDSSSAAPATPSAAVNDSCALCGRGPASMPHVAECCGAVYCYYCIHGMLLADRQAACSKCEQRIRYFKRA